MAKVIKILGATSLLLEDVETSRLVTRHLSDVYVVELTGNFGNLYKDTLTSHREELLETFGGRDPDNVPIMDAAGKDHLLENEQLANGNQDDGGLVLPVDKESHKAVKGSLDAPVDGSLDKSVDKSVTETSKRKSLDGNKTLPSGNKRHSMKLRDRGRKTVRGDDQ